MAKTERKYKGSLSLGKLELEIEAQEQLYGAATKIEAVDDMSVVSFDDGSYPALNSLALLPKTGEPTPPAGTTHLFDGEAVVVGTRMAISAFRTN